MRIIGGHDYYDIALSLGIDRQIVLVRYKDMYVEEKNVGINIPLINVRIIGPNNNLAALFASAITVVFCDRIYKGIRVLSYDRPHNVDEYIWDANRFMNLLESFNHTFRIISNGWSERSSQTISDLFAPAKVTDDIGEYMMNNKLSILLKNRSTLMFDNKVAINPFGLRQIGFAKAVEPYTAFQELSMWIGGVLGGNSPATVQIVDDKVLAESHGFDKESFRGPRIK